MATDLSRVRVEVKKVLNKNKDWVLLVNGQVADTTTAETKEKAKANFSDPEKQPWTPAFVRRMGLLEKA